MTKRKTKIYSNEDKEKLLADYFQQKNIISQTSFCKKHSIPQSTFSKWYQSYKPTPIQTDYSKELESLYINLKSKGIQIEELKSRVKDLHYNCERTTYAHMKMSVALLVAFAITTSLILLFK